MMLMHVLMVDVGIIIIIGDKGVIRGVRPGRIVAHQFDVLVAVGRRWVKWAC